MTTKNSLLYVNTGLDRSTQVIILSRLAELKAEWKEALGGDLERVTIDLKLLFEDIERIVKAD